MAIGNNNEVEKKLWNAADQLRANSELSSQEYSAPVLGLIFLRYADYKFTKVEEEIKKRQPSDSRRKIRGGIGVASSKFIFQGSTRRSISVASTQPLVCCKNILFF